jgi:hypothetical protein
MEAMASAAATRSFDSESPSACGSLARMAAFSLCDTSGGVNASSAAFQCSRQNCFK